MELGHDSLDAVREILVGWDATQIVKDLAGIPRIIVAQKPDANAGRSQIASYK
jgi:hypothetical protein